MKNTSKIRAALMKWWLFNFRNWKIYQFEVGGFRVVFRRFFLHIKSISGNFSMSIRAGEHAYGYLLTAAKQDKIDQIHGYCAYMYKIAMSITTDSGLVNELNKALSKYDARMEKKAAKNAEK